MEITLDELNIISGETGFNIRLIEKDYLLTYLLYLIKDINGIYFKGGTALHKIFLNYERLSEDLDFTVIKKISDVEKEIKSKLKGSIFSQITHDKRVEKFTRLIVHYKLFHETGTIFIDLNRRAKLLTKSEIHKVKHFYKDYFPEFVINTLSQKEMIAEKLSATIGRNKPRDHFDMYIVVKNKLPIDLKIVKNKCQQSGYEFDLDRMFSRAKKLKNRWDEDMVPLLAKEVDFVKVMKTLTEHFKYKKK